MGCKPGYLFTKEYVPVYTFPVDKEECERWLAALPFQLHKVTVHIGICQKHWPKDAEMMKVKRYRRPVAAPSLFPNTTPSMFIQNHNVK